MRAAGPGRDTARPRGASPHPYGVTDSGSTSQLGDVFGGWTFLPLHNVELDAIALGERLEPFALNGRMVNEAVLLPVLPSDEAKTLRVVEPLHGPGGTH